MKQEFQHCQTFVLYEKRNIDLQRETDRLEHIFQYLFIKKRSIYSNVILCMQWYLGMQTHVINNERVNSTRSWVQSTYRQHMSDDI